MFESRRIVFMGTPEFAVPALDKLLRGEHPVVAVYSQPDRLVGRGRVRTPPPVKGVALEHGIEVLQPESLREPSEVERLAAFEPDLVVVAAYGQILPQSVLDIPEYGCLNIHPSLLPSYRGATPVPAAILAGDLETGVTIMKMDAGMDTGPIVSQFIVHIEPDDTSESLGRRLADAGARLLDEILDVWFDGTLVPVPQDDSLASYTRPITKGDGLIDWRMSAVELERRVRAYQPWPGCYTHWQGKVLRILQAVPLQCRDSVAEGRVVELEGGQPAEVGVGAGEGVLGLLRLQLEGKNALPVAEFLKGQRSFVGSVLGS
jgi:methionyl-tRNA formyltransferase